MAEKDKATKEPRDTAGSERDDDAPLDKPEADASASSAEEPKEGAPDDAAARVAEALGVDDGEGEVEGEEGEEKAADAKEPVAPPNRAARRREEAMRRRKKRPSGAATVEGESDDLPKDKNARAKELLKRRQEQAEAGERRPINLLPGEMVDDALARTWSASGKWLRTNFNVIQWFILAGVVGVGGYMFYTSRTESKAGNASGTLVSAVAAERGRVMAEDKRSDEEKQYDVTRVFPTTDQRADTALASYNQVIDQHPGTGAAMLAKLGQAGVLLEKRDYPHALDAFNAVLSSPLGAADPDVKGRALEGAGFAKEGKGDLDGALETFKDLSKVEAKGFRELSKYHQARIHLAKGEKEKAKDLLMDLLALKRDKDADPTKDILNPVDKGSLPGLDSQSFPYLKTVAEELLRTIDPAALPARQQIGGAGGSKLSPEEIENLIRKAREAAEKKGADSHDEP